MVRRFTEVSEEEIVAINEAAFFYPSDLVNSKTAIPPRVSEERWIYTSMLCISVLYPPLLTSPSGDSCILLILLFLCILNDLETNIWRINVS